MNFIEDQTSQKLRGGYYTPPDLASFLVRWIGEIHPKHVLEPSCGDGVFFAALGDSNHLRAVDVVGFEIDPEEASKARAKASDAGLKSACVHSDDFLKWALARLEDGGRPFDAVLGNPPFVRYQYLPPNFQLYAERIFRELEVPFTKHTNAWVPFILASVAMLRPGGRLAMVVPSEIIHVTHAQGLRSYLGRECRRIVVIDPEELWFTDTLQGAVILLVEKRERGGGSEGVAIYPVKGRNFLSLKPSEIFDTTQAINGKTVQGKWTGAILDVETRLLIDEVAHHKDVKRFLEVAKVDVGIVTGANKFFLVSDETVDDFHLRKWAHPMFGRSEHCPGLVYDDQQHEANASKGLPTNFLWFARDGAKVDSFAMTYIKHGESQKLHTRYKCRVRTPWYTVPSVYSTEIGMLKRSHHIPRLILNRKGAYTTDTAYRIRARDVNAEKLVSCFLNPLTALSAELEGRHYGGGVLELIPSEIERLLVPLPSKIRIDLTGLDAAMRTLPVQDVLTRQGKAVLGALGLSKNKQDLIMDGWRKLRDRRHRTSPDTEADSVSRSEGESE